MRHETQDCNGGHGCAGVDCACACHYEVEAGRAPGKLRTAARNRERARTHSLERAARKALEAIRDELAAAGPDDVAGHPTLRRHERIADELERALAQ